MIEPATREVLITPPFSLATTCGPVAWARGRWSNLDWLDNAFVWVGWEDARLVWRIVRQVGANELVISGSAAVRDDESWAREVLGVGEVMPAFADPAIAALAKRMAGLRPQSAGSLFEGLVSSIVGQSISVAAAATVGRRLAAQWGEACEIGGRLFWAPPRADHLASAKSEALRASGLPRRRAEALVAAGRAAVNGDLPSDAAARADPESAMARMRALPLVGPWTAASALVWGIGAPDAFPSGDVALLRAARRAYTRPNMSLKDLDILADGWRPHRGWAARLLWTDLLGVAESPTRALA
ncbi:MAG: hypothetical protein M3R06_03080 [Chloroflexota bacterium]|nr:hypothetical protein [Chloroflexota bacterium]